MWRVVSYKNLDLRHTKVKTSISKSIGLRIGPDWDFLGDPVFEYKNIT
jgi:hypothetical protein